ncbi:MAG TPA: type IV pilin protein [Casimicrobiaceae bacterium]|jgi:type IV pilus assembly protein PilE
MKSNGTKVSTGFTVIELLVAVAIVGILATIAIPQYGSYITRSRILDAFAKLSDYRTRMEQYFLDRRSYLDDTGACGVAPTSIPGSADSFQVACIATARSFVYTATGIDAKGMARFVYTIDEAGSRGTVSLPSGWTRNADCWTIRADGSCV